MIVLLAILLSSSVICAEPVDTTIALTVGPLSFSNYQVEKQCVRNSHQKMKSVLSDYKDNCLLLAEAKNQGFFEDTILLYQVRRMEYEILGQAGGVFYWKSGNEYFEEYSHCGEAERRKIEGRFYEKVLSDSNVSIDNDSFDFLFELISKKNYTTILERHNTAYKERLFRYEHDSGQKEVSIFEFVRYYHYSPMRLHIDTKEKLKDYIRNMVYAETIYALAEEEDITYGNKHQIDRKNFHERLVLESFLKSLPIEMSNIELQDYYQSHLDGYRDGTDAVVDYVVFDDKKEIGDVFENLMGHFAQKGEYWTCFMGLRENAEYVKKIPIKWNDTRFGENNTKILFNMPTNHITMPLEIANKWYIFFKHSESGSRIKSFEEVRPEIEKILRQQKLEQKKKELVAELKKKYTIVDNIDYDYYTSEEFLQSINSENRR